MSNIIVYGNGKTGRALADLTERRGDTAFLYDDDPLKSAVTPNAIPFGSVDKLVLSPGIRPDSPFALYCAERGIEITGELQYCFDMCKARCVSVTGTNGKTTVTELIYAILSACGKDCRLLGNGGVPFSTQADMLTENQTAVLESSSFQLMTASRFSPYVSVFVSLAPDHLDYHTSYEEYINAKCNNFINQDSRAFAIFNADEPLLAALSEKSRCYTLFYSADNPSANCRMEGDEVVVNLGRSVTRVKSAYCASQLLHNRSDILGAVLCACVCGVSAADAVGAAEKFSFLPHRMQKIARHLGVTFIDDSKATNIHATLAALRSCENCEVALILGGSDKGYGFDDLFRNIGPNVRYIAAIGETAEKIRRSSEKYRFAEFHVFASLREAVGASYRYLKSIGGGTLLLSNACASFDMFSGYAERGDVFQSIVKELAGA